MNNSTVHCVYGKNNERSIVLDKLETVRESADSDSVRCFTYGKIIKLEHQSDLKNNGVLVATNENETGSPWDLYRSYDDGDTWEAFSCVPELINKDMNPGYQPYIFELPVDMGEYKKGTILFTGCSYGSETRIPLFASTDLGETWVGLYNIAEGGGYNQGGWSSDGIWEPCLIYDDKTNRLYCFYSDEQINGVGENHIGGYNQRLVYKYTSDLKTWSQEYNAVAVEGDTRPGMPMVTKMGNGQWAIVYENVGAPEGGTPIYIKFTDNLDNWEPASDNGKLILSDEGSHCGSSPAITWTPAGGECGTLIVTANGQVPPSPTGKCDLFISHDYGKTFVTVKNPIPVQPNQQVRSSYSPGFYVDKEGSVYYINDPEKEPGADREKLMIAKLRFE